MPVLTLVDLLVSETLPLTSGGRKNLALLVHMPHQRPGVRVQGIEVIVLPDQECLSFNSPPNPQAMAATHRDQKIDLELIYDDLAPMTRAVHQIDQVTMV